MTADSPANPSREELGLRSSTCDPEELRVALEQWLSAPERRPGGMVTSLEMPERTGISSLTLLLDLARPGATGPERLVARVAPDASAVPVFPSYDLEKQAMLLSHLANNTDVRVPKVHWYEGDPAALGVPFFVMDRVDGDIPPDVMPYPFGSWVTEASLEDQRRLQDSALRQLARVHAVELPAALADRLQFDRPGDSALLRHVAEQRAYYEWAAADGVRSPLLEAGFEWLQAQWPRDDSAAVLSWGDSRIGNMIFQDFEAAALLDWEMCGIAPPGVDLGWMIYLHRWFDDIAESLGLVPMRHFMQVSDAVAAYEGAGGSPGAGDPESLRFYLFYAALRHGAIMFRVTRRQILFGEAVMPEDPDELVMHRATLAGMMSGEYWETFGL